MSTIQLRLAQGAQKPGPSLAAQHSADLERLLACLGSVKPTYGCLHWLEAQVEQGAPPCALPPHGQRLRLPASRRRRHALQTHPGPAALVAAAGAAAMAQCICKSIHT